MTLFLAFVVQFTFAQEKTISGNVTDETGPLPGVSILIEGTTQGTETDFDGNYTITAKTGDVLHFSFMGMTTVTKMVGTEDVINVSMVTEANTLDEVVVVGYGTTTKKSFTGTVKTVNAEVLEMKSVSNVAQALTGEVAGVTVINTSGQPGTVPTIRVRGFGSVNGNRSPLYVVDGIPFSGALNTINPADIESTTVLKDATATAIYGARGANGVILINTKRGKANTSSIVVDVKSGVNVSLLDRHSRITSPEEYIEISWNSLYNRGVLTGAADPAEYANSNLFGGDGIDSKYNLWNVDGADIIDPATGKVKSGVTRKYEPENWEDYGFQPAYRTEANINMSGGAEKTRYFTSFGYIKDEGAIINSDFERLSARTNLSHEVKPWLTGIFNMGYARTETNNNGQSSDSGSIFWFTDNIPSIYPLFLRDENGNLIPETIYGGNEYDYGVGRGFGALTNSIADAHYDKSNSIRNSIDAKFALNFKFSESLTLENSFGGQYYINRYNNLNNPFFGSAAGQGGSIFKRDTEFRTYNLLNLLRYKNNWNNHTLEVLAAHEATNWLRKTNTASKSKMVDPNIDDLNNFVIVSSPPTSYTDEWSLESYFGQVNYNFDNKYYLTGSIRHDGSSRFVNEKWGTFGSVGASWIISEESFMNDAEFINYLKLKASYGTVGEQAGVGFYPGYNTFNVSNLNDNIAISPRDIGNPDLTWETSKMFQTGIEFSLWNFIDTSFDYYIKDTDNLLFDRRVGPSVGYAIITVNDGELRNSGFEFDIATHIINKEDYKLDFSVNGSFLNNELTAMPIDPATGEQKLLDISGSFGRSVGHSLFDFYMREWAGVDPADGSAMWYEYYHDENNNGEIDSGEGIGSLYEYTNENPDNTISKTITKKYADATQKYVNKSAIPKVSGAFRLNAQIYKFDISTQFIYSYGGYGLDGNYQDLMDNEKIGGNNWSTDIRDRWQNPGDITDIPRLSSGYDTNIASRSTRFLTKTDYLSFNNFRIGFTLDEDDLPNSGLANVNVWFSGDNLFLLSERNGFNPTQRETGASERYLYSPLTNFSLGLRVKF
ncbi:MAG: SusC/RagA family TonB-linked outer membrane protein [Bacteroidota bacterium]